MDENPYAAPAIPTPIARPIRAGWGFLALAVTSCCATLAAIGAFVWAANYRLDHTDAFGRSLAPPPIPLHVADGIILSSLIVGCAFAVLSVVAIGQCWHGRSF
jgi:hypothetical protein